MTTTREIVDQNCIIRIQKGGSRLSSAVKSSDVKLVRKIDEHWRLDHFMHARLPRPLPHIFVYVAETTKHCFHTICRVSFKTKGTMQSTIRSASTPFHYFLDHQGLCNFPFVLPVRTQRCRVFFSRREQCSL